MLTRILTLKHDETLMQVVLMYDSLTMRGYLYLKLHWVQYNIL